jgi:hypothetical protein
MRSSLAEDFLSEVFIVRDEDLVLDVGFVDDGIIVHSARSLVHREYVVPMNPKPLRHRRAGAFIYQEPHLGDLRGQRHEGRTLQ